MSSEKGDEKLEEGGLQRYEDFLENVLEKDLRVALKSMEKAYLSYTEL